MHILPLLPQRARSIAQSVAPGAPLLEIRLRAGQPMQLVFDGYDRVVYAPGGAAALSREECGALLSRICQYSVFAWEEELRSGFVTLPGGFRVGVCGRAVSGAGGIERFSDIVYFSFRIVREVRDCALPLLPALLDGCGRLYSTLILSPPGRGKTTLLRDLVRLLSDGLGGAAPHRVSLVDERLEVSGAVGGVPTFDVGVRTDVITGSKKADGLMRMLAAMTPDVLACDELSRETDVDAALEADSAGAAVLATAHARDLWQLQKRPPMQRLYRAHAIRRYLSLAGGGEVGRAERLWDDEGKELPICSG